MKPSKPVGFAALLAKMPKRFVTQAKRVEERARRRREAQAKRFEEVFSVSRIQDGGQDEWQDTVAHFNPK
ncbi:hypothetical protein J2X20_003885 [Pelomonas saccharophila]|uniref:Uncharacterized protein n=1 Tax=Roseateles saccharophilus TaxID=304 RepID=A0ABU1YQS8_ROSSA|nr:hypothetical protein [Roseateles saccharophilus]MDR7271217.1 hypothetical protein [Roseateles saccharophilus]